MDTAYYNGNAVNSRHESEIVHKKDKKKATIQAKLNKLSESFIIDKDYHYRSLLQNLQLNLSTVHNGTNETILTKTRDIEEARDYELIELKLWQSFQIARAEKEFYEDIEKANKDHDEMVKLVKEKLYANLEKQIKQLKEDKVLLDMANSHSYNMDASLTNVSDFHKNTRSSSHKEAGSLSATMGYVSDSHRRRLHRGLIEYNSTNAEESANDSGNNSSSKKRKTHGQNKDHTYSSNDDTFLSDAGGDLSSILFGKEKNEKVSTRHSSKSYVAPAGLKNEEVNEDLALLKSSLKK